MSLDFCISRHICSAQPAWQGLALHLIGLFAIPTTQSQLKWHQPVLKPDFDCIVTKMMTKTKTLYRKKVNPSMNPSNEKKRNGERNKSVGGQKMLAQEPVEPLHQLLPASLQGSPPASQKLLRFIFQGFFFTFKCQMPACKAHLLPARSS